MPKLLKKFAREEEGQDLVEYGLLALGIAVVVAAALPALATAITTKFPEVIGVL